MRANVSWQLGKVFLWPRRVKKSESRSLWEIILLLCNWESKKWEWKVVFCLTFDETCFNLLLPRRKLVFWPNQYFASQQVNLESSCYSCIFTVFWFCKTYLHQGKRQKLSLKVGKKKLFADHAGTYTQVCFGLKCFGGNYLYQGSFGTRASINIFTWGLWPGLGTILEPTN